MAQVQALLQRLPVAMEQVPGQVMQAQMQAQVLEFRAQQLLRVKLQQALVALASKLEPSQNMGVLQVWRPKTAPQPVSWQEQQLYVDPELYLMGDACFAPFRLLSCQSRQFGHQGMPGRVLRSGCVQVVQNLRIIPDVLHPRSKLSEAVADEVGEVVYVPVFDTTRPHVGPVAVLEALLLARATDSMLVANFISVAGSALAALQLSLSNPLPQPVRRSRLEGRKPCPVHPDSSPDLQETAAAGTATPAAAEQQPAAVAGGASSSGTAAAAEQQYCCSPAPGSPTAACGLGVERQPSNVSSSSSAATTTFALMAAGSSCGGSGEASGAAAVARADCALDSTLSSRAHLGAAMLPPCLRGVQQQQQPQAGGACRKQQRWQLEQSEDEHEDADVAADCRPGKLQRTLSICRTKSVSAGLDQVLLDAAGAAVGVLQTANSC